MEDLIEKLQSYEQMITNLAVQKQVFTTEINEVKSTLEYLKSTTDDVFKVVGGIMVKVDKDKIMKELKDKLDSKPMFTPILTLLARIKESLDHIPDYLEKVVEKAKEISEEAKTRKIKRILESIEDMEEKVEDLVKMIKKIERKHHINTSEVKVKLEEMLKLIEQVKVQLKNNNTSEAVKLMMQLKQLVDETRKVCIRLRLGKEISTELVKTRLMLGILIRSLESSS